METFLKTFSVSFILRSAFSGAFFVIAFCLASHKPSEFVAADWPKLLPLALSVAVFAGVTVYGLHRSIVYPVLEWLLGSNCAKKKRKAYPLISVSTKKTLRWRWVRDDAKAHEQVNDHLDTWGDFIHLQYTSALCIVCGTPVGWMANPGPHTPFWPFLLAAMGFFLAAFISNWRHHAFIEFYRDRTNF